MKKYRTRKAGLEICRSYDVLVEQWGTETQQMDIATRYGSTHVIAAGREGARPVVLLHGVGDDAALMWIYNAKALAQHFRIYALDTIGGPGKSEPNAQYNRTFADALWLDDVLDGLGLKNASLVGVSHGGYLTQLYALERPERVDGAVAIASAVAGGEKNSSPLQTMMKIFLPEALLPTRRNVEKLICKLSGAHAEVFTENAAIMDHYRWLLKGFSPASMAYHTVRPFSEAEVNALRERVVYLVGEEDPFEKLGGKEALLHYGMRATFYPDAGHGLNHELAEQINAKLIELLQ